MTFLAHIDGRPYAVPDESVNTLKAAIVKAVRGGGDIIDVLVTNGALVKVLLTSSSTARIEKLPEPVIDDSDNDDGFAITDLEM